MDIKAVDSKLECVFIDTLKVTYDGQGCPLIKKVELFDQFEVIKDRFDTFQTSIGVVERHFWRITGTKRSGIDWRLID